MNRTHRTVVAPRFGLLALLAVAAMVVGMSGSHYLPVATSKHTPGVSSKKATRASATPRPAGSTGSPSAPETAFSADPPPRLFDAGQLADAAALINAQRTAAETSIKTYWAAHGTAVDDAGFVGWVVRHLPPAPASAQRRHEMATLASLKVRRSASGLAAARWLSRHGSGDLWQVLRTSQTGLKSASEASPSERELRTAAELAGTIARQASRRATLPAPYVIDSSVKDNQKTGTGTTVPSSYPSTSSALSAAATGYLESLSPERRGEYRFMQSQVDTAALYRADAFPSDLSAGTYIGDLVSTYILVTRGHTTP